MKNTTVKTLIVMSVAAFLVSLVLPAFETNVTYLIESRIHEPSKSYLGYEVFFLGWASVFIGVFAWLANVGYLATLVLVFSRKKLSLLVSIVTLLIALSSLTYPTIERGENGYDFYITDFDSGFYFWLTAIVFSCAASLIQSLNVKVQKE